MQQQSYLTDASAAAETEEDSEDGSDVAVGLAQGLRRGRMMIESLRRKRKFGERNKLLKMELQCCSGEWCNERRCREIEIHVHHKSS